MTALGASPESPALTALRRRGQFLISGLMWAAAGGLAIVLSGYTLVVYHYGVELAERMRTSLGYAAPEQGPDWFMLAVLSCGPAFALLGLILFALWYRRVWLRRVQTAWPDPKERSRYSRWQAPPIPSQSAQREQRAQYLMALLLA